MKALYPGSFDPLTKGHLDIIERASLICNELIVAVLKNVEKKPFFTIEERLEMIRNSTTKIKNIKVISFKGLVVDLAQELQIDSLIRGMRDIGDFRLEWETAQVNKSLGNIETLFLMTNPNYAFISSSRVREIARLGGNVAHWVPESVFSCLEKQLNKRRNA